MTHPQRAGLGSSAAYRIACFRRRAAAAAPGRKPPQATPSRRFKDI